MSYQKNAAPTPRQWNVFLWSFAIVFRNSIKWNISHKHTHTSLLRNIQHQYYSIGIRTAFLSLPSAPQNCKAEFLTFICPSHICLYSSQQWYLRNILNGLRYIIYKSFIMIEILDDLFVKFYFNAEEKNAREISTKSEAQCHVNMLVVTLTHGRHIRMKNRSKNTISCHYYFSYKYADQRGIKFLIFCSLPFGLGVFRRWNIYMKKCWNWKLTGINSNIIELYRLPCIEAVLCSIKQSYEMNK